MFTLRVVKTTARGGHRNRLASLGSYPVGNLLEAQLFST
jgi:hypothetical protein